MNSPRLVQRLILVWGASGGDPKGGGGGTGRSGDAPEDGEAGCSVGELAKGVGQGRSDEGAAAGGGVEQSVEAAEGGGTGCSSSRRAGEGEEDAALVRRPLDLLMTCLR